MLTDTSPLTFPTWTRLCVSASQRKIALIPAATRKTWHLTVNTFFLRSFPEAPEQAGFLDDQFQYYEADASLSAAHSSSSCTDAVNSWSHTKTMQQPSFLHRKAFR